MKLGRRGWSVLVTAVAVALGGGAVAVSALTGGEPDTGPPTPPGEARIADLTCTAVTLSWSASTDDVGVAFYDIFKDGQLMESVGGDHLATRLTVVPGANWGLYVNSRDEAGNVSQASATVTVQAPQCGTDEKAPTTPTGLAATVSGTTITLRWQAATDDVAVAAYDIYRNGVKVGAAPVTTFTDSALAPRTDYGYEVAARDAQGNTSSRSARVPARTEQSCANPICSATKVRTEDDVVWGLAELPDGTLLFNRRDAHEVVLLDPRTGSRRVVGTVPGASGTDGEGGLMGLAVAPSFATDHWVYLFHTTRTDNRIVRLKLGTGGLDTATLEVLLSGIPRNKFHNGGRLRFGPDGKLYAATGDGQNGDWAQRLDNLAGKVLRLNPDGSRPDDNPFNSYIWSYGHRNPQGLAFDSQGRLWEQEFGNVELDETNLIVKGGNYGWPLCEGTSSHQGAGCATPGFIAPKHTYPTAEGSCSGLAIVQDVVYVACLRGMRLYRATISGSELTGFEEFFAGAAHGRLRTVEPGTSGLWIASSNGGDKDSSPGNTTAVIYRVTLGG
ncbi:glucose/arabinose dehydrogenase [Allocatelliglobosispora scoriae]|uniref:Glucose/arabinose dehydrogenase n=1 Tax=Allocatelliglobosispora scoriae TaxID=643052 RepID=A0A841BXN9_9ACTN|nr:PQQ-dependent sugar dehydrogenase [Allocatelliglobosispora scoriae]MBB5872924.1 glucose/arabinose dehydrogenase [Allocatelliglobosispora scoriae]